MDTDVAQAAAVPMAMQVWKRRTRPHTEVKIVWAQVGQVAYTSCWECTDCPKGSRCPLTVEDQSDFTNRYQYARSF
jgi:hypothetical protein